MQTFGDCAKCSLPKEKRVGGYGCRSEPDLMIVGEAPGAEEVAQGRPFVGRAGKLLREILTALHVDTSRVYYTNACCCRPPMNRTPKASDIMACKRRLISEIEEIQPKLIIALGNTALSSLLGGGAGITRRRGMFEALEMPNGFVVGVIPTLHPAGILRMPDGFRDLADDLSFAIAVAAGEVEPVEQPPYDEFILVDEKYKLTALIERLNTKEEVAIDLETTGLDPRAGEILSCSFTFGDLQTFVIDWHELSPKTRKTLCEVMQGCNGVYHNGQFDVQWLWTHGADVGIVADTMLAHYCLDERKGGHGLKRLATSYFHAPEYDAEVRATLEDGRKAPLALSVEDWEADGDLCKRVMLYNGADSYYTMRLWHRLKVEMEEDDVVWIHDAILIPAVRHFIRLEMDGILVYTEYLQQVGEEWM
jgi:uracil-DNA glycosylase family 4